MSWLTSRRPRPMLLAGLLTIEGLGVGAAVTWLTVRTQPIPPWSVGDLLALLGWLLALYGSIAATFGVVAACVEWLAVPRLPDHPAWRVGWRLAALVPCLVFAAGMIWRDQPAPIDPSWPSTTLDESIVTALDDPPPVVLLVIDGADLDAKILPLIDAGDLPTFAGLMREGTWGELASLRPTRSPVLWTSIITGQPARRHGIQGFVHPHLAGIDRTLRRFPFGSGLNRKLLPRLERGGFAGIENQPFTSADRRARPLWDIVAEHHPVGVYRWLVTWPASPTRGFMVAGGVYAGLDQAWTPKSARWIARQRRADDRRLDRSWRAPLDLFDRLSFPTPSAPEPDAIARYVAPGATFDPGDPGIRLITQGLKDPAGIELPILIDATRPKFVAANVFTVDTFQHVFDGGRRRDARRSDGSDPFAGAVAQRYRDVDAQLGALLDRLNAILGPDLHVLIVSDHGFDFEKGHHWAAPPGVFFARGPAFAAGRRVDDLGLLDLAPLCLDLLGFPLADDLPGASTMTYRQAFDPSRARPLPTRIPTFERGLARAPAPTTEALSPEQEEQLRSLGYLD